MIVQCPECQSRYSYDDERFERKPSRKLRCFQCREVFDVVNPAYAPARPMTDADETGAHKRLEVLERDPIDEEAVEKPKRPRKRKRTEERAGPTQPEGDPKIPNGLRFSLAVISGPDSGKVYRIDKPRIVIGRSHGDLSLTDSETSRSHAAIIVYENTILLDDLESTNGTFHKGKPLTEPIPLHNHSEFQVGNTTLMLIVTRE
ncbi:MAG TPA: FHA domain-containing protein [Thermoanaerobaculia bacterium]|nr:FHA domain-containing protein [Thermoanaerobaculia bacterium]